MFQIFAGIALGYYLCFNFGPQINSIVDFKKAGDVITQGAAAVKAVQSEAGKVIKTP